ncbi:BCCT family transporter, partial [Salmonella enterica]|uniref:BCCT family transporter n=1 Tax=Salmonella enterica TaxID=28901 RepID=UPI001BB03416
MSKAEPSRALRIMIAVMITVFSLILMWIGGLEPLEVVTGILGIPIIVIQLLLVYAAIKMIKHDR